jgi:3-hydroxyisobutyrate dehydrogenase-like beta-hydroxyacid dehydrogenase
MDRRMAPRVGFIGLGTMGAGMARNLAKAGFPLTVATHTPGKAQAFARELGGRSPRPGRRRKSRGDPR